MSTYVLFYRRRPRPLRRPLETIRRRPGIACVLIANWFARTIDPVFDHVAVGDGRIVAVPGFHTVYACDQRHHECLCVAWAVLNGEPDLSAYRPNQSPVRGVAHWLTRGRIHSRTCVTNAKAAITQIDWPHEITTPSAMFTHLKQQGAACRNSQTDSDMNESTRPWRLFMRSLVSLIRRCSGD